MNKFATIMRESSTARFFIPAGILLIIFGIAVFVINNKNQNYIKTDAIVTNVELLEEETTDLDGNTVEAKYNVDIKYSVEGKEYNEKLEDVSKSNVGDKIIIYYNPDDPSQITMTKSLILPIIMTLVGVASLSFGIINAVNTVKKNKKMKEQERSWANGQ